eukprot:766500-Rhodomonas_salina.1
MALARGRLAAKSKPKQHRAGTVCSQMAPSCICFRRRSGLRTEMISHVQKQNKQGRVTWSDEEAQVVSARLDQ